MNTSIKNSNSDSALQAFNYRKQAMFGLIVLLGTGVLFSAWAIFAPLDSGAVARGKIVVDTNRKTIQHLSGGMISEIHVNDGDVVKSGDILLTLDTTESQAERDRLYAEWLSLLAENARLKSEYSESPEIAFPEIFIQNEFAERKAEYISLQNDLARARQDTLRNEINIYQNKREQLVEQISGLTNQVTAKRKQLASLQDEINSMQALKQKEYISKIKLSEAMRRHAEVQSDIAGLVASIAEIKIKASESELDVLQVKKRFKQEISTSLKETGARIFDIEDRMKSAEQRLLQASIRSPSDGIIFNSQAHTKGGIIGAGESVMEIVPTQERLLVEAEASSLDIESIHNGQTALVRFVSLPVRDTPLLEGQVNFVAADAHENSYGNDVFKLRIEISQNELLKLGAVDLVPGMPVEVLVRKGERTLLEYLLKPLSNAFFKGLKED